MTNPFHFDFPSITYQHVLTECRREHGRRPSFYDRRVKEGRMTAAERDHKLACSAAWIADTERIIAFEEAAALAWERFKQDPRAPFVTHLSDPEHGISWRDRRAAIEDELRMRRRVYPRRVREGAMTQKSADHQIACLQSLAARYDDGFDWRASNGERPQHACIAPSEAVTIARREWREHRQALKARQQPAQQGEMSI